MTDSRKKDNFTKKTKNDGSDNPKYIDLLDEDKPIAGQKFTCVSFISPEQYIQKKELYFFNEFIKNWDFTKSMEKFRQFLNFISYKHNFDFNKLTEDYDDFIKEEVKLLKNITVEDEFKTFLEHNEEKLETIYNQQSSVETNTKGIKVRGCFPSQEEAELRCKLVRQVDPNHDVYVGPVGTWMPWNPEAYKTGKVEYLEEELNQLMAEKQKNESKAKENFDDRIRDSKRRAMEENKCKARQEGNVLTQTIDKDDNLVNITNMNTQETNLLNDDISVGNLRKELFEGSNIVTNKDTDHGLSDLQVNKKLESSPNLTDNITVEMIDQKEIQQEMENRKLPSPKSLCNYSNLNKSKHLTDNEDEDNKDEDNKDEENEDGENEDGESNEAVCKINVQSLTRETLLNTK